MDGSAMQAIRARHEIEESLRELGADSTGVNETYERLRSIVLEYLPPDASLRHGELVGMRLMFARYWPAPDAAGAAREREMWDGNLRDAAAQPASPLAADQGVRTMVSKVLQYNEEKSVRLGCEIIEREKLPKIFPPLPDVETGPRIY
jgi:hypothetical protein